jgi:Flp pilus assembly pilin Flp
MDERRGGEWNMWTKLNSFVLSLYARVDVRREEGQTLVEYALIIALVSLGLVVALTGLKTGIANTFENIVKELEAA